MMTDTTLVRDRTPDTAGAAPALATCSQKREQQRAMPIEMLRMVGLDVASQLLGKANLAEKLGITVRALNYKMNAERGIDNVDVLSAARALEARAERLLAHAGKLRAVLPPSANLPDSTKSAAGMALVPLKAVGATGVAAPPRVATAGGCE
jgi:hypothetical protein